VIQTLAGFVNARIPRVVRLELPVEKPFPGGRPLHITMVSDVHLGTLIGKRKAEKLVSMINAGKPDLILFAGDLVDEDIAPVIRKDVGVSLLKLKAPLGVYAITGNHEYIGGVEKAVRYLSDHNIRYLRDTVECIGGGIYLVGREDKDRERFSGKPRKALGELLSGIDRSLPVILLDHQPFNLEKAAGQGIDLQLSGHTHHGQVWPFNYITKAMYSISWGYRKIGHTHFYVSCGFGTWGPPIRLGNRPEIVQITLIPAGDTPAEPLKP
jgi:predicted MPP superfamily phosphohydrolase